MALPMAPNATCAIYRADQPPPAAAVAADVPCFLRGEFTPGSHTHQLLLDRDVDVRDPVPGGMPAGDLVYVPDADGTPFQVVFVERVGRNSAGDHLRVYLNRQLPPWPTNNL